MTPRDDQLRAQIENRLAASLPEVELLACERVAAERLRLTIDHPDGVDLGLCERVTKDLRDLLVDYALEVSSPGPERPLSKPEHFRRYIGRCARVRTREPLGRSLSRSSTARAPDRALVEQKSFTGELVGASDDAVTVAADGGVVSIPYAEISRSNLVARRESRSPEGRGARGGDA